MPSPTTKTPPAGPAGPASSPVCSIQDQAGVGVVHFRLDAVTLLRLKRKAGAQGDDPVKFANWLWQNILSQAISSAAY
jgi:hypothetical protein